MNMQTKTIALEKSTNTHLLTEVNDVQQINDSIIKAKVSSGSKVIHGEHGSFAIESDVVLKYTQQELNPITKKLQNAWD